MKALQFLYNYSLGTLAFGKATQGVLFHDIHEAIGGENTLGATLYRMRKKGFITSTGGLKQTRYRLTAAGRAVVEDILDIE